jgi:hypothetical protein
MRAILRELPHALFDLAVIGSFLFAMFVVMAFWLGVVVL